MSENHVTEEDLKDMVSLPSVYCNTFAVSSYGDEGMLRITFGENASKDSSAIHVAVTVPLALADRLAQGIVCVRRELAEKARRKSRAPQGVIVQ